MSSEENSAGAAGQNPVNQASDGGTYPHDLADAYALDALSVEEREIFEAHIDRCKTCRAEVAQSHQVMAQLVEATEATPPIDLKGRVLDQIVVTPQLSPVPDGKEAAVVALASRRRTVLLTLRAAAAVVLIAAVGSLIFLQRENALTVEDVVAQADSIATQLNGAGGQVEVIWSADADRVAIIGRGLVDPEPDMIYQLWLVVGDDVSSAGLFATQAGAVNQVLEVEDLPAEGWGVTMEPGSGSEQPTGEILYVGVI